MNFIFKIIITAFAYLLLSLLLKDIRREYVFLMRVAAILLIVFIAADEVSGYFSELFALFEFVNFDYEHIKLMLKVVAITILTDVICDVLEENGEKSVSNVVTLSSKFLILFLTLPLVKTILIFCLNLVE